MIKYKPDTVQVVFNEIPDEITLAIEITNCQGTCEGCHSPWLREDIGEELTPEILSSLIDKNRGITCVCFMGEGKDYETLKKLAFGIRLRSDYPYKVALYSGRGEVEDDFDRYFDYIKVGPYKKEFGPLNKETTNQRLYEIERIYDKDDMMNGVIDTVRHDITYKFWRKSKFGTVFAYNNIKKII